jgi:RHS repeat-associated protein
MSARLHVTRRDLSTVALVVALLGLPQVVRAQTEAVEYYGVDALGSVRVVFRPDGTVIGRADYAPFGDATGDTSGSLPPGQYTGQERDPEAAQDYFHARYYQPRHGRFGRVDPIFGNLFDPQALNRYAYAKNSPLVFVDPDGLVHCKTMRANGEDRLFCWTEVIGQLPGAGGGGGGGGDRWGREPHQRPVPSHPPAVPFPAPSVEQPGPIDGPGGPPPSSPASPEELADPCNSASSGKSTDTYFVGLNVSLYALTGLEFSLGYYLNPGGGSARFDFGGYFSAGVGIGLNVGAALQVGKTLGGTSRFAGEAGERTVGIGPVSYSALESPFDSNAPLGWNASLGAGATPVSGNRSATYTYRASMAPWSGCR